MATEHIIKTHCGAGASAVAGDPGEQCQASCFRWRQNRRLVPGETSEAEMS